ncbi:hypothetical protein [Ralstonia sp. ASV6]|uniref:hypothetical protein n=1 Tax=Ralstonia sp. ASV6 TaxID=2795124 RepID=UPI0018ECE95F|nr:hypothetical protein [Ralstonia sp. ASV6]
MPIYTFTAVPDAVRSAQQHVEINNIDAGEVWREQVHVPDGKGRQSLKWRWFARCEGETKVLGKGTRAAVIVGAGFTSKHKAAEAIFAANSAKFA